MRNFGKRWPQNSSGMVTVKGKKWKKDSSDPYQIDTACFLFTLRFFLIKILGFFFDKFREFSDLFIELSVIIVKFLNCIISPKKFYAKNLDRILLTNSTLKMTSAIGFIKVLVFLKSNFKKIYNWTLKMHYIFNREISNI